MGVGCPCACLYLLDFILDLGSEGSLKERKEELTHPALEPVRGRGWRPGEGGSQSVHSRALSPWISCKDPSPWQQGVGKRGWGSTSAALNVKGRRPASGLADL